MKKFYLLLIPLLFIFKGCELFDLEMKKVTYLFESNKVYVYETKLEPGEPKSETHRLDRSTFDIPSSAEITKFRIKNIWLSFDPGTENKCGEGKMVYSIIHSDFTNFAQYRNEFFISDQPINEFILNSQFDTNINQLRQRVENAIIGNQQIVLGYAYLCNETEYTDITTTIRITIDVEYTNCEEILSGTDLEDC